MSTTLSKREVQRVRAAAQTYLKKNGITQRAMAAGISCSQTTVSRWLRDKRNNGNVAWKVSAWLQARIPDETFEALFDDYLPNILATVSLDGNENQLPSVFNNPMLMDATVHATGMSHTNIDEEYMDDGMDVDEGIGLDERAVQVQWATRAQMNEATIDAARLLHDDVLDLSSEFILDYFETHWNAHPEIPDYSLERLVAAGLTEYGARSILRIWDNTDRYEDLYWTAVKCIEACRLEDGDPYAPSDVPEGQYPDGTSEHRSFSIDSKGRRIDIIYAFGIAPVRNHRQEESALVNFLEKKLRTWTENGDRLLFHGTSWSFAQRIITYGIDPLVNAQKPNDFGHGFYLTDDSQHAIERARCQSHYEQLRLHKSPNGTVLTSAFLVYNATNTIQGAVPIPEPQSDKPLRDCAWSCVIAMGQRVRRLSAEYADANIVYGTACSNVSEVRGRKDPRPYFPRRYQACIKSHSVAGEFDINLVTVVFLRSVSRE